VRQELRGERTGMRYATGTRVQVQVSRVDLDGRKIDFRLVRESDELRQAHRAVRDKVGASAAPATAVEALEQVRRADREAKSAGKSKGKSKSRASSKGGPSSQAAPLHPVKAARRAAVEAKTGEARTRKRR
jgi:ribonuclease R